MRLSPVLQTRVLQHRFALTVARANLRWVAMVTDPGTIHPPNRRAARALACAACCARFVGAARDSSMVSSRRATRAMSTTAASKAASFTLDGRFTPLIFLTNCSDAARISSSVAGGSTLKRRLIFLHTACSLQSPTAREYSAATRPGAPSLRAARGIVAARARARGVPHPLAAFSSLCQRCYRRLW